MTTGINYDQHLKKCRAYVKNLTGWERSIGIAEYFKITTHPHPDYTLNQMAVDRSSWGDSDRSFNYRLMCEMAYLTSMNEEACEDSPSTKQGNVMLKLLMFTDSKETRTCILKEQKVNHNAILEGVYHIGLAKLWITEPRDKKEMLAPFKSGISPVAIVFYSTIESEVKNLATSPEMNSKLQPKLNGPEEMEQRLQDLLNSIDQLPDS
jgi:hypothetical protein